MQGACVLQAPPMWQADLHLSRGKRQGRYRNSLTKGFAVHEWLGLSDRRAAAFGRHGRFDHSLKVPTLRGWGWRCAGCLSTGSDAAG